MTTSELQTQIDQLHSGDTLILDRAHQEIQGPCRITKALILDGRKSTLWAKQGPVLSIESDGVKLKDLIVEVTGEEEQLSGLEVCALQVRPNLQVSLSDVTVRGTVLGLKSEEGNWRYPRSISLMAHPDEPQEIKFHVATPVACRLISEIDGLTLSPNHLAAGEDREITLLIEPLSQEFKLRGDIVIATTFLQRRIAVTGNVLTAKRGQTGHCRIVYWSTLNSTSASGESPSKTITLPTSSSTSLQVELEEQQKLTKEQERLLQEERQRQEEIRRRIDEDRRRLADERRHVEDELRRVQAEQQRLNGQEKSQLQTLLHQLEDQRRKVEAARQKAEEEQRRLDRERKQIEKLQLKAQEEKLRREKEEQHRRSEEEERKRQDEERRRQEEDRLQKVKESQAYQECLRQFTACRRQGPRDEAERVLLAAVKRFGPVPDILRIRADFETEGKRIAFLKDYIPQLENRGDLTELYRALEELASLEPFNSSVRTRKAGVQWMLQGHQRKG